MSKFVTPISEVYVNTLRAAAPYGFPMMDKPPFGYTDAVGEYASCGFPTFDADGNIISANDSDSMPGVGGVEFNSNIKGVYPRHVNVKYDNLIQNYYYGPPTDSPGNNPIMGWYNFSSDASTYELLNQTGPPAGFYDIRFETTSDGADFNMFGKPDIASQGFTWFVKFGVGQNAAAAPSYVSLEFQVGGSGNAYHRWFAISLQSGIGVHVAYNDVTTDGAPDSGYWQDADIGKMGAGVAELLNTTWLPQSISPTGVDQDPEELVIECKLLGGQIALTFGDQQTPWMFPVTNNDSSGTPDWYIDTYLIYAANVQMVEWSVHQTKWYQYAQFVSQEINLGFVPSDDQIANINWIVHFTPGFPNLDYTADYSTGFYPAGTYPLVGIYDLNGTIMRYYVQWLIDTGPIPYQGYFYADFVSVVRAITFDIPGSKISFASAPALLSGIDNMQVAGHATVSTTPPPPSQIDITHTWDQSTLSVNSSATLTFNNFNGLFSNYQNTGYCDDLSAWQAATGIGLGTHFWMQVLLGQELNGVPMTGPRSSGSFMTEFTGVGGLSSVNNWSGSGHDHVTIQCRDRWAMLDVPVWNLPWMDGWNVYSAIAYMAALGTIGPDGLGIFSAYVPVDSNGAILFFAPSPGLPDDQQYFLPSGPAGTNLSRFGNGQMLRDIMLKVSNTIGFALFFDVFGVLQFEKFQVASGVTPTKTFGEYGTDSLNEIWNGSYTRSLEDTRNSITVIGINALGPLWFPLVAHQQDEQSIYDPTVGNYIGWVKPLVWVDSLFTNSTFAQAAADALFAFLDLPDKQLSLSVFYPADTGVFPIDTISMEYSRSGASGTTFFVVQTQTHVEKGVPTVMTIQARIVPTS